MRVWIAIWLLACCGALQAAQPPLRVGVLPYLSPRTLLLEFAPVREFLQQALQRDVQIHTAPTLARFLARTHNGDFDLVITAPHFARMAQREHGFLPLIAIRADFYALLLVPRDAPAQNLRELRGQALHLPNRLSYVSLKVEDFLLQRGIDVRYDLRPYYYSTDNNAILALARSGNGAAAAQRTVFDHMPAEISARLRILGSTQGALSLIVLAHPRSTGPQLRQLREALARFPYTEQGLAFFQRSHAEFVPADAATMEQLDASQERLEMRLSEKR
ncbi:PhnD/SsuA/transferrin family substrate-binding protein [Oxalobacteraceae bacterium]|nr:PhnD/SsuA/transferrin family substrate-binding protein [Oxalobacteraceae bacterium]